MSAKVLKLAICARTLKWINKVFIHKIVYIITRNSKIYKTYWGVHNHSSKKSAKVTKLTNCVVIIEWINKVFILQMININAYEKNI